jgi:hypothetical protein
MDVLNTKSRTDVKGQYSSLELSGRLEDPQNERTSSFKRYTGSQIGRIFLVAYMGE